MGCHRWREVPGLWTVEVPEILGTVSTWGSFLSTKPLFVQKEEAFGGERRQEDRYEEREKGRARKGKTMEGEPREKHKIPKWSHRVTG